LKIVFVVFLLALNKLMGYNPCSYLIAFTMSKETVSGGGQNSRDLDRPDGSDRTHALEELRGQEKPASIILKALNIAPKNRKGTTIITRVPFDDDGNPDLSLKHHLLYLVFQDGHPKFLSTSVAKLPVEVGDGNTDESIPLLISENTKIQKERPTDSMARALYEIAALDQRSEGVIRSHTIVGEERRDSLAAIDREKNRSLLQYLRVIQELGLSETNIITTLGVIKNKRKHKIAMLNLGQASDKRITRSFSDPICPVEIGKVFPRIHTSIDITALEEGWEKYNSGHSLYKVEHEIYEMLSGMIETDGERTPQSPNSLLDTLKSAATSANKTEQVAAVRSVLEIDRAKRGNNISAVAIGPFGDDGILEDKSPIAQYKVCIDFRGDDGPQRISAFRTELVGDTDKDSMAAIEASVADIDKQAEEPIDRYKRHAYEMRLAEKYTGQIKTGEIILSLRQMEKYKTAALFGYLQAVSELQEQDPELAEKKFYRLESEQYDTVLIIDPDPLIDAVALPSLPDTSVVFPSPIEEDTNIVRIKLDVATLSRLAQEGKRKKKPNQEGFICDQLGIAY
jgi:hypothetical protein